ncbi:MAG TPA: prolyl oligopeptidase family serine peptidase [Longimicrobium sp.]|nr:prolyl oligopeptidase family serine peptidase [Longimicrobium sp.]
MRRSHWLLLVGCLAISPRLAGQPGAAGTLIARVPCAPLRPYEAELAARQAAPARPPLPPPLPDSAEYGRLARGAACERLTYWSDGLRVVAILVRPATVDGVRLPLVVFNHGSTAERGALPERVLLWQARLVDRGYVVIAPQYRGGGGGEGRDEFGGADVADVLNVLPLAASLGFVDMRNAFMHGHSRGGMMTYLAVKAGAPVRAAAVTAGVADLAARTRFTPWVADSVDRVLMPDYDRRAAEHYHARSAVNWPERLTVPLLIMHGTADERVPASSALALAQRLQDLGLPYELVMLAGGTHDLTAHRTEMDARIVAWFDSHRLP